MSTSRLASVRPRVAVILVLATVVTACSTIDSTPTLRPSTPTPLPSDTPAPTRTPRPTPSPSPDPTPRFTNEPDAELAGLIPSEVVGIPVVVAPFDEFALTPGDVAIAFGEIGDRFSSLALAYVEQPRTTLYAMRVDGDPVATADLEPHLATAGRYVGIAGLDPDPWEPAVVGGHQVWVRPEDAATAAGTHIYTWAGGEFVFLLMGVDEAVNRALVESLPGEPPPTPRPSPSASPSPADSAPASASTAP